MEVAAADSAVAPVADPAWAALLPVGSTELVRPAEEVSHSGEAVPVVPLADLAVRVAPADPFHQDLPVDLVHTGIAGVLLFPAMPWAQ